MELFKIFGRLGLEGVEAFNADLEGASKKGQSFSSKLGKGLKTVATISAAAIGAAASAVGVITKAAVASYGEYEQLVGGVDTLFKDSSQKLQQYAAQAYQTAGMSANEYMSTVTSFSASLLQSLGGDTSAAADVANMALMDMSDNANKMGTDMASIQNAYQGFAKQNYTMLDNLKLGYGGTKTEMERLLKDAQELTGVEYDINNLNDVYQAIHVIQEELDITGTTAKEASTTIQGSVSSMKAAWQNLLVGLADDTQDFGRLLNTFVNSAVTVLGNLLPRVQQIFSAIPQLISGIAPMIPAIIQSFLPGLIEGAIALVDGLVSALPSILSALGAVIPILLDGVLKIVQSLQTALPQIITTIISFITNPANLQMMLNAAVTLFMALIQAIPQIQQFLYVALPQIISTLVSFITEPGNIQMLLDAAVALFMAMINAIPLILTALTTSLPIIINQIVSFLTDGSNFDMIVQAGLTMLNALLDTIPVIAEALFLNAPQIIWGIIQGLWSAAEALFGMVGQLAKGVVDKFKSWFGIDSGSSTVMEEQGTALAKGVENGLSGLPEAADSTFAAMNSNITTNMAATRDQVSADFAQIGDEMSNVSIGAGDGVAQSFGAMRDTVSGSMTSTSSEVTSKAQEIKTTMDSQLTATQTVVSDKFQAMNQSVGEKMAQITETVKSGVEAIKTAFNVELKFKSVVVPKFSLSGKFDAESGKVPTVKVTSDVKYFAEGGIVDQATIFGMLGNRPMVAGEAGKEAIAPIDTLQGYVAQAVASQNAGLIDALDRILNAIVNMDENMGENMKDALDGTGLTINKREFGRMVRGVLV